MNTGDKTKKINDILKEQVRDYLFPSDVKILSTRLFNVYSDIKPNFKQYAHPGTQKAEKMVCLEGTIPVNYKGTNYNIPITIWIPKQFPKVPPIPRVTPTAAMSIKPSKYVDNSGTVFLPYLHEWTRGSSDLCDLVQTMSVVFSEEPPVFAKPAQPHMVMPAAQPGYYQPPGGYHSGPPAPYPYPPAPGQYPPRPGMPVPFAGPAPGPPRYQTAPAVQPPPYPPSSVVRPPSYPQGPVPPSYPQGPVPASYPPGPVPPSYPPGPAAVPPPYPPFGGRDEERIRRDSLVSAVHQKVRLQMDMLTQASEGELSELRATNQRLRSGQEELKGVMCRIQQQQAEMDTSVALLERKSSEIEQAVQSLQTQRDNFSVDQAIVATAPLYDQILTLYARQCAIEDALYYLGEGLRKRVLSLEEFLQNVRELSTEQYKVRALLQKACRKAGLF